MLPTLALMLPSVALMLPSLALMLPSSGPQTRFWTEIYDGAKHFYLSGMQHGR